MTKQSPRDKRRRQRHDAVPATYSYDAIDLFESEVGPLLTLNEPIFFEKVGGADERSENSAGVFEEIL